MALSLQFRHSDHSMKKRSYLIYGLLLLATLVLGYSSRWSVSWYPDFYATYAGDTWWAILVYWGLCIALALLR